MYYYQKWLNYQLVSWQNRLRLVLVAVKSCKSKNQVIIVVVNHNYHLLAKHNSVVFTTNLQLMFIILQPT